MYDPENIASLLHGESMRTAFIYYLQVSCPQSLRSYIQGLTDPSLLQVAEDMNESVWKDVINTSQWKIKCDRRQPYSHRF